MRSAAVIFGCLLLSAAAQSQQITRLDADFKSLEPYVNHTDIAIRRASVLLLTEAILSEPQPRCMETATNTRDVLMKMRPSDLDIIFDRCNAAWKPVLKHDRIPGSASQYEQLCRFIYVMRRMQNLEGFKFEAYIDVKQEALTRLAMVGMALRFTPEYKERLETYAGGSEPMATWAKVALAIR